LSLVWAVLDRASVGWRESTMTPAGLRQQDLRRQLLDPPALLHRGGPPGGNAAPGQSAAVA
jgi:putative transposase